MRVKSKELWIGTVVDWPPLLPLLQFYVIIKLQTWFLLVFRTTSNNSLGVLTPYKRMRMTTSSKNNYYIDYLDVWVCSCLFLLSQRRDPRHSDHSRHGCAISASGWFEFHQIPYEPLTKKPSKAMTSCAHLNLKTHNCYTTTT